ncbi:MAG: CIA30 family protein [Alphaproteobacteria bacterium]
MTLPRRNAIRLAAGAGASAALALSGAPGLAFAAGENAKDGRKDADLLIIDDLSSPPEATVGGRWSYVSDRVMGGVSDGGGAYETIDDRLALRLFGNVSTANNGGFVQLSLRIDGRRLGADRFDGIELDVWGNGEDYNVHVTTTRSFPPWRFYKHTFETQENWRRIRLPWSDFTSETFRNPLDPRTINRLNLTAYARDFEADLAVSRIALYAGS